MNPIHEGTHGIQSLDLLGRKLWLHNGKGQQLLLQKIQRTLTSAKEKTVLAELVSAYQSYLDLFIKTTMMLGGALQKGEVEKGLANSAVYLDMMGKMVVAWLWIEMADKAIDRFSNSTMDDDKKFLAGKLQAAQYFLRWELPKIKHQANLLQGFDETCMSMQADWF